MTWERGPRRRFGAVSGRQSPPIAPPTSAAQDSRFATESIWRLMTESEEIEVERPHTLTGDIRTHEGFHSRYLEHDRTVMVYLPPGYDHATADRYPVLYLHDGQNVFDQATSFGDEWHVDETAQELI